MVIIRYNVSLVRLCKKCSEGFDHLQSFLLGLVASSDHGVREYDMDLLEVTDGDQLCFQDAMIARNAATVLLSTIYICFHVLYSFSWTISC
jgi:hypothetical protein